MTGQPAMTLTMALAEAMGACCGPCNSAWRATGHGDPFGGEPVWCPPCASQIRRALGELDYLGAMLAATADGHREQPISPARLSTRAMSPSAAADDLDELTSLLYESEDSYRAMRGWPSAPRHGYLAPVTTEIISWLLRHLPGILESSLAESFGREVRKLHRELAAKAKAGEGRHRKPAPCPRCGLKLLTLDEGADHVVCAGCNRHMPMAEYHEHVAATARSLERAG